MIGTMARHNQMAPRLVGGAANECEQGKGGMGARVITTTRSGTVRHR
jgi:hypothetical protein